MYRKNHSKVNSYLHILCWMKAYLEVVSFLKMELDRDLMINGGIILGQEWSDDLQFGLI